MKKILTAGLLTAVTSCVAAGISATITECPDPATEIDCNGGQPSSEVPEPACAGFGLPYSERPMRILNQRQARKIKRQQPHGRK